MNKKETEQLKECIAFEKKRDLSKEKNWSKEKQEGYIAGLETILRTFRTNNITKENPINLYELQKDFVEKLWNDITFNEITINELYKIMEWTANDLQKAYNLGRTELIEEIKNLK